MSAIDWEAAARLLRCPLCAGGLAVVGGVLRCEHGHSFDIAREGYVNLLATGRPAPKLAGDSAEMLRARRAFLDRGYYQPLSDAIDETVADSLARRPRAQPPAADSILAGAVLDVGCGEGYYLGRLAASLRAHASGAIPVLLGLDIAKDAVRLAAKRYPAARFVAADVTARWPVADASMAAVLDIFAPRNPAEFVRTLAPGGLLLVAVPTPAHLAELRDAVPLLDIEPGKQERLMGQLAASFELASTATLEFPLELPGADAALLVRMTPSARHVAPEALAALAAIDHVHVTASVALLAFTKRS